MPLHERDLLRVRVHLGGLRQDVAHRRELHAMRGLVVQHDRNHAIRHIAVGQRAHVATPAADGRSLGAIGVGALTDDRDVRIDAREGIGVVGLQPVEPDFHPCDEAFCAADPVIDRIGRRAGSRRRSGDRQHLPDLQHGARQVIGLDQRIGRHIELAGDARDRVARAHRVAGRGAACSRCSRRLAIRDDQGLADADGVRILELVGRHDRIDGDVEPGGDARQVVAGLNDVRTIRQRRQGHKGRGHQAEQKRDAKAFER